jgi:exopolyphosphatase/guanosine-5'-triphosphate,3'-diphosphate pyrophosphatase
MRIAVVDLGSTSFRLVVVDVDAAGRITQRAKKRAALNLGLVVGTLGEIPNAHARRAVNSLTRFRAYAVRLGVERVIAVATSALRDASNRRQLADRFELAIGGPIRFLSGEEEATLAFSALRRGLGLRGQTVLGLDLGGGSLELAVGDGTAPAWVSSLPLGAARLTGMFAHHDPMRRSERQRLQDYVEEHFIPVAPTVHSLAPDRLVAAGGTVKALARLIAAEMGDPRLSIHDLPMTPQQLRTVRDRLLAMRRSDRRRLREIGQHRVDVIATGAVVLAAVAEMIDAEVLTASEWGLREGIILEAAGMAETLEVGRVRQIGHLALA